MTSCNNPGKKNYSTVRKAASNMYNLNSIKGYADVNGLKMYYEIYGKGNQLVLIHGGGSTIQSTFGRVIPLLAKSRKLIAIELQAHGRTSDRNNDLSFEQDADDIDRLMEILKVTNADFLGFSNGGTTALQIAIRHPERVNKIIAASALYKRNGIDSPFWNYMEQAKPEDMPQQLKDSYTQVSSNPNGLQVIFYKDVKRMVSFKDIPDEKIKSIKAPTLIILGDKDIIKPEHAIELHRLISNSELAVIPGGHGEYIGEITTLKDNIYSQEYMISLIENFLNK
ncbi:MAG: alpha/beta hydrolase [Ignavibacteriales bacterium]|nr:MAG: alpha/beta hydrolase [Ignavibacteriales bacterium]